MSGQAKSRPIGNHALSTNFPSYTLTEAAGLRGRYVYAFQDEISIFYVGKTTNPGARFKDYSKSYSGNFHLLKRLREAGDRLRVLILENDPDNLESAEEAAIVNHAETLVNRVLNPYRRESGLGFVPIIDAALCVQCKGVIKVKKSKYCRKCLGALLGLTPGKSKQQLRDELEQIRLRGTGKTSHGSNL